MSKFKICMPQQLWALHKIDRVTPLYQDRPSEVGVQYLTSFVFSMCANNIKSGVFSVIRLHFFKIILYKYSGKLYLISFPFNSTCPIEPCNQYYFFISSVKNIPGMNLTHYTVDNSQLRWSRNGSSDFILSNSLCGRLMGQQTQS